jgi:moderate conductance mechanosensitive channel
VPFRPDRLAFSCHRHAKIAQSHCESAPEIAKAAFTEGREFRQMVALKAYLDVFSPQGTFGSKPLAAKTGQPAARPLRALVLWLFILSMPLVVLPSMATAQANTAPPAGMSQSDFDALVREVSESVARSLAERGIKPQPAPAEEAVADVGEAFAAEVAGVIEKLPKVVGALPILPEQTYRIMSRLDRSPAGGYGTWHYLGLLAFAFVTVLAAIIASRRITALIRERWTPSDGKTIPLGRLAILAGVDIAGLGVVWFVAHSFYGGVFADAGFQTVFALCILRGLVTIAAAACVFDIWLQPKSDAARIVPVNSADAALLWRWLVVVTLVLVLSRIWVATMSLEIAVDAVLLVNAVIVPAAYLALALRCRHAFGAWLRGLWHEEATKGEALLARYVRIWLSIVLPIIAIVTLTRFYAALADRPDEPVATITTILTLTCLLLGETLIRYVIAHPSVTSYDTGIAVRLLGPVSRIARIVMLVIAALVLLEAWVVVVFGVITPAEWPKVRATWTETALVIFVAFVLWEMVKFFTDPHVGTVHGDADDEGDPIDSSASRFATLVPVLRISLAIMIITITTLVVLSGLGVNITPLVAGASVFGLAVSFGSQTLVRDVVSGIFYLAEDAFRVGEYIDSGSAKGTVEGFTLRSIRLRHQNGQVHTIPFGQLGQITNFSRDWASVKFNLRFARDTDLEKLRKIVKQIGQEMLQDPELKGEFLDPLKMQGVEDVLDNAIVVRFKLRVKPNKPSFIQRQAIRRMVAAFGPAGISFANATVAVQTVGGSVAEAAAAAASQGAAVRETAAGVSS